MCETGKDRRPGDTEGEAGKGPEARKGPGAYAVMASSIGQGRAKRR